MPSQSSNELQSALREKGWYVSEMGMSTYCQEAKSMALNHVIQWLMNEDIKYVGDQAFPKNLKKCTTIPHNIVVQISKIRNIASPKAYHSEVAPRLLKVTLTDGHTSVAAIEYRHVTFISADTPPGTKLLLRADKIPLMGGYLLLQPSGVEVLGGHVAALVDKWKISKEMQTVNRSNSSTDGPPPWIPFGQRIQRAETHERNFKSLDVAKPEKVDTEFEAQRQATIAEATKVQTPGVKVFGGGDRKLTGAGFLIYAGYSPIQVENALRICGNNVDKALNKLQSWEQELIPREDLQQRGMGRGRKGRGAKTEELEDTHHTRPSGQATLFDFLQPHIDADKKGGAGPGRPSSQTYEEAQVTNRFSDMKIDDRRKQQSWNNERNEEKRNGRQDKRYEREDRRSAREDWKYGEDRRNERGEDKRYDRGRNDRGEDRRYDKGRSDRGEGRGRNNGGENRRYEREDRRYERDDRRSVPRDDRRMQNWNSDNYSKGGRGQHIDNQGYYQQNPPSKTEQRKEVPYEQKKEMAYEQRKEYQQKKEVAYEQRTNYSDHRPTQENKPFQKVSQYQGDLSNEGMVMVDVTRPPPPIRKIAVNDQVMAKYWEDGKFYKATVTATSGPAYFVHFTEYGNTEQVFPQDIHPVQRDGRTDNMKVSSDGKPFSNDGNLDGEFSGGTLEFRRGGGKPVYRSGRPTQQTYMPPQQRARFEY